MKECSELNESINVFMKRYQEKYSSCISLIITGDFNNIPHSEVYSYMTEKFGVATTNEDMKEKDVSDDIYTPLPAASSVRNLRSAYDCYKRLFDPSLTIGPGSEPDYTTCNFRRRKTIDYIFYSPGSLQLTSLYEIPSLDELCCEEG